MTITLKFEPRDLWVGVYWTNSVWNRDADILRQSLNIWSVYLCLIPALPLVIKWSTRRYERWGGADGGAGRRGDWTVHATPMGKDNRGPWRIAVKHRSDNVRRTLEICHTVNQAFMAWERVTRWADRGELDCMIGLTEDEGITAFTEKF